MPVISEDGEGVVAPPIVAPVVSETFVPVHRTVLRDKPVEMIVEQPEIIPVDRVLETSHEVLVLTEVRAPVEKIVERIIPESIGVPVERVVERVVERPVERIVEKIVHRVVERVVEVPVDKVVKVQKFVPVYRTVERLVEVPVEQIVERRVEVPVERTVERTVEVPVEQIVEKTVEVPVERVVDRIVEVPRDIICEKIVEVEVDEEIVEVPVYEEEVGMSPTVRRITLAEQGYCAPGPRVLADRSNACTPVLPSSPLRSCFPIRAAPCTPNRITRPPNRPIIPSLWCGRDPVIMNSPPSPSYSGVPVSHPVGSYGTPSRLQPLEPISAHLPAAEEGSATRDYAQHHQVRALQPSRMVSGAGLLY
eukprot:RCo029708